MKATLMVFAAAALLAVAGTPSFAGDDAALLIGASSLTSDSGEDPLSQAVEAASEVLDLD